MSRNQGRTLDLLSDLSRKQKLCETVSGERGQYFIKKKDVRTERQGVLEAPESSRAQVFVFKIVGTDLFKLVTF